MKWMWDDVMEAYICYTKKICSWGHVLKIYREYREERHLATDD